MKNLLIYAAYIFLMGMAIALLCMYYISQNAAYSLSAACLILICLFTWYMDSRISYEWKEFRITRHRSGWFLAFGNFSSGAYEFVCDEFERTSQETCVSKIIGFSSGFFSRWNSYRLGFRRVGDVLRTVSYLHEHGETEKEEQHFWIAEKQLNRVYWHMDKNIINVRLVNVENNLFVNFRVPVYFKCRWGFRLNPYNGGNVEKFKATWRFKKIENILINE